MRFFKYIFQFSPPHADILHVGTNGGVIEMIGLSEVEYLEESTDKVIAKQSIGFGLMLAEGWEQAVDYALYEVSHHNIGIISKDNLEVGNKVTIEYRDQQIFSLIVHQIVPKKNLPSGYQRFRLISTDPDINFEHVLPESSHRKFSFSTQHNYQVRFARFRSEERRVGKEC